MENKPNATVYRIWMEEDWSSDIFYLREHDTGAWFLLRRLEGTTFFPVPTDGDAAARMIAASNKVQKEFGVEDSFVVTRQVVTENVSVPAVRIVDAPAELRIGG